MKRIVSTMIPPTTVERYFSVHFAPALARLTSAPSSHSLEDVCITRHHNGVCVICLSPRHPIVTSNKRITDVAYRVEMKEVKGKRKKGGVVAETVTRLCTITCEGGDVYSVQCGVAGRLVEYNQALSEKPELINQKPLSDGYLAILCPWNSKVHTAVDHLLTKEQYDKVCDELQGGNV